MRIIRARMQYIEVMTVAIKQINVPCHNDIILTAINIARNTAAANTIKPRALDVNLNIIKLFTSKYITVA